MAKTKKQKKRSNLKRRIHNSFDILPGELLSVVNAMIIDNQWPTDFKNHYPGSPRYIDIISYCKLKGYIITKSALGRYTLSIRQHPNHRHPVILPQEFSRVAINERVRDYGHIALASVTANYSRVVEELQDYLVHPERNQSPPPEKRIPFLRNLAAEYLPFIEQAVTDLKSLDVGDSKV